MLRTASCVLKSSLTDYRTETHAMPSYTLVSYMHN